MARQFNNGRNQRLFEAFMHSGHLIARVAEDYPDPATLLKRYRNLNTSLCVYTMLSDKMGVMLRGGQLYLYRRDDSVPEIEPPKK